MDVLKMTASYSTPTSVILLKDKGTAKEKIVASTTAQKAFFEVKNGRQKKSRKAVQNIKLLGGTLKRRPDGI